MGIGTASGTVRIQSRRRLLHLVLGTVGLLSACGPLLPAAGPRPASPVSLVFGHRANPAELAILQGFADRYRAVALPVTVDFAVLPAGLQELRAGLLAATAGGTAPDLFIADGPWLPEFATKGLFDRLPREALRDLQAHFTEGGQRYGSYKGVAYVYPFRTTTHGLYFHRQLFVQAGLNPSQPSQTMAAFREAARRLARRDAGGALVQPGFVANHRLLYLANFVYNHGGSVINEDQFGDLRRPSRLTLGEPPALAALQVYWDLHQTDRAAEVGVAPSFAQGKVGMTITTSSTVTTLATQAPALDYGVAPLPTALARPAHQLTGFCWGVSAGSRAKEAAWALLQWLNTADNVLTHVQALGFITTHKGAMADPRATSVDPERMRVFYGLLPTVTHVRPKAVAWSEIEALVEPEVRRMLAGELAPRQLVAQIEGPVRALLAQEP